MCPNLRIRTSHLLWPRGRLSPRSPGARAEGHAQAVSGFYVVGWEGEGVMGKDVLCSLAESPKPFQLWDPWEGVVWVSDVKVGSPGFSGFIMDPGRKEDSGWRSEHELPEEG